MTTENKVSSNPADASTFEWKPLLVKLVIGFAFIFCAAAVLGFWLREPIRAIGKSAVDYLGLPGLFAFVLGIDSVPTPFSYAHVMYFAIEGGVHAGLVFVLSSMASILGGVVGYSLGRIVGMPTKLNSYLTRNHPEQFHLLKEYGAYGVALVGALPLPFALGTWLAGSMKVRFWPVLLACTVRIPKTAIYIGLILSGTNISS